MARIYKRTDRIRVRLGDDVTVTLAPLSIDQKTEIQQALVEGKVKGNVKELTRGVVLAMRYALKGITGVVDADNMPYQLDFENDMVAPQSVEDLMNLEFHKKLTMVCTTLVNGVPAKFTDETGAELDGVELVAKEEPVKN